mgnify:CR=1 FL=1
MSPCLAVPGSQKKLDIPILESVAETLDEIRTKKLMPEYSTADGGLGFSSADLARAKHNYFGSDATMAQDNYADAGMELFTSPQTLSNSKIRNRKWRKDTNHY